MSRIIRGEDKENGAAAQDKVSDRVLNHYEYDAFGNTISCEERVANRFRYQSGSKADTKPYTNSRPSFRKGVVEEVWENAKGPDGLVRDPNTGEVINWTPGESRKGVWDMGHLPEAKYSEMHEDMDIMGECRCQNQTLLETNQFHAKFFSRGILAG